MKTRKKARGRFERERRKQRPRPSDWILEPFTRGEEPGNAQIDARAVALNADWREREQVRRAIERHEARRTAMVAQRAPVEMLNRYGAELRILRRALEAMERQAETRLRWRWRA